jgi:protoporphyrinogen/coproporphyrinogen III oxidase
VRVTVVGGGLAGLFTARRLLEHGIDDVVVLEAESRAGGVARTITREGYLLEPGVGSMALPHPRLSPILAGLGAGVRPAEPAARVRHIWTGDRLVTLEAGPTVVLAPLGSTPAKLRALLEPLIREPSPRGDETLGEFCRRRLGKGLGSEVSWLAASGVYAGDPDRLSARSAFPSLVAMVEDKGSLTRAAIQGFRRRSRGGSRPATHVPTGSMADIADQAAQALGDRFRPGHRVTAVRRSGGGWVVDGSDTPACDAVVLACEPSVAATLAEEPLAGALRDAESAPVAVVWFGGPRSEMTVLDGYGILTGREAGTVTRGVLIESSYAPHRAPEGHTLLKVIAGGSSYPGLVDEGDDSIVQRVLAETSRIIDADLTPSLVEVVRHRTGIPQYPVGHGAWLDRLDELLPDGLHLTGWGYRGVGISHLAVDADRVAARITR